jgi:general L-amino acid transport system permease protein
MSMLRAPAIVPVGASAWLKANLFQSPLNTAMTLVLLAVVAPVFYKLLRWGLIDAVFKPDPALCKAAAGACWGFIVEKIRLMTFATYPYEQQWRPLLTCMLLIGMVVATLSMRMHFRWLGLGWLISLPVMWVLMRGGLLGLTRVETEQWGGLPLTLILASAGIVLSFPLAVVLALGRRSQMPAIRALSIGYIEIVRGVPLITVLFMASLMIPLFLPEGINIDKVLRAQIGFILFAAAYEAEVIRGGLQSIPKGQYEAADALGLSYWQKTGFIILPQALKTVIPPMVNTFIGFFKDTSLVIIIGLFDLLGAVRLASVDVEWRQFYIEGLVFLGLVYFGYAMAAYSRRLEARLSTDNR